MMKNLFFSALLIAGMASAQSKNVGDFTEVKVFDRIVVELVPSTENKVDVSGKDRNDVELINKNGQLKIRMVINRIFDGENTKVTVYFKDLKDVDASEGASISNSTPIKAEKIDVTAKEGAQIELNIDVADVNVKSVTGANITLAGSAAKMKASLGTGGILDAQSLKTENTDISINAGGDAKVSASGHVDAQIRGGGDIKVYGHPEINKKITLGGSVEEAE